MTMKPAIMASQFIGRLNENGHIKNTRAAEDIWADYIAIRELPLLMRLLIAVGALMASGFFIGFLAESEIVDFDTPVELACWGVAFIAGAVYLFRRSGGLPESALMAFRLYVSLIFMAMGKLMFIGGFVEGTGLDEWGFAWGLLLASAAVYRFYPVSLDRFLSSVTILAAFLFCLVEEFHLNIGGVDRELLRLAAFHVFLLLQLAAAGFLFLSGKTRQQDMPVAYGVAVSLCLSVWTMAAESQLGGRYWAQDYNMGTFLFANIAMAGALVWLIGWAAGDHAKLAREPFSVGVFGCLLLGLLGTPGILLSIGLMVLGYARHDRILLSLGMVCLPVFIVYFYHNMDITLLHKSGVLVASGLVLLGGRLYLQYRVRQNTETST